MLNTSIYNISLYTRYAVVSRDKDSVLVTWEDLNEYIKTITDKEKELLYQYTTNGYEVVNDVFDYFDTDSNFQLRVLCRMFDILMIADEAKKVLRLNTWRKLQKVEKRKDF